MNVPLFCKGQPVVHYLMLVIVFGAVKYYLVKLTYDGGKNECDFDVSRNPEQSRDDFMLKSTR